MIVNRFLERLRNPSCKEVLKTVQSYLDGEVDVETARRVAAHLADCPDCNVESEVYRSIKTSLANAAEPVDPEVLAGLRAFSERLVAGEME